MTVVASLGGRKFEEFRIDLVNDRALVGEVERRSLMCVVGDKHGDFPRNAEAVQLYPLADQIADKICAIHETHGAGHPSSRTRDLVDLLLIAEHLQPELAATVASVTAERDRRQITLPETMTPPPLWASNWPKDNNVVRHLDPALHVFAHAVDAAGLCYNRVLSHVAAGTKPSTAVWSLQHRHWAV